MSASPPIPYPIRGYLPGDEVALVQLFERAYGKPVSESYWRWKIKGYPTEVENVWVAFDGEQAIFQYAGLPLRYHLVGQVRTGMVGADAMTDPNYRRNGLLTRGSQHAFDVWQQAGVAFNIGLPNERWGSRQEALGWKPLFLLRWLFYPLWPEALIARKAGGTFLRKSRLLARFWNRWWGTQSPHIQIDPVVQTDITFDHFWESIRGDFPYSIVRDQKWVTWRYMDCPVYPYRVLAARSAGRLRGYAVYRLDLSEKGHLCFIPEIVTARQDTNTWRALLQRVLQEAEKAGVESVLTQAPSPGWQAQQYRKHGFLVGRHGFQVRMVPFDPALPFADLCDPEQWLMCGGDFDAI